MGWTGPVFWGSDKRFLNDRAPQWMRGCVVCHHARHAAITCTAIESAQLCNCPPYEEPILVLHDKPERPPDWMEKHKPLPPLKSEEAPRIEDFTFVPIEDDSRWRFAFVPHFGRWVRSFPHHHPRAIPLMLALATVIVLTFAAYLIFPPDVGVVKK